jgi:hypothetical protein
MYVQWDPLEIQTPAKWNLICRRLNAPQPEISPRSILPPPSSFRTSIDEMIKKNKKNARGDWPMTSEKLVNNYFKIFAQFVNSIDFTDL